jgi:hypothetical protein
VTQPPVGRGSVIALATAVSLAIGFVGRVSFAASAALLAALALVFRVVWWLPWALAALLVAVLPLVATRSTHGADTLAAYVVVLLFIGFALFLAADRRRRRAS